MRLSLRLSLVAATAAQLLAANCASAFNGDCGQPTSNGTLPTTSDALTILKSAVGQATFCNSSPCICDVDSSGAIQVTDGLRTLKVAVGQSVELECDCVVSTTSTTTTSSTTTTTLASGCFRANALTVLDVCTGLEWARVDPNDFPSYTWSQSGTAPDGTVFTVYLEKLNSAPGYAGHRDWRLPTSKGVAPWPTGEADEWEEVFEHLDPLLGLNETLYWSGSTVSAFPENAWVAIPSVGVVTPGAGKSSVLPVRAVRRMY